MLLDFLCPGLFSGQFAYGSIAMSGVGRRTGLAFFKFLVVELVVLVRLDDDEDGGFSAAKVTCLPFESVLTFESFRRAFPLAFAFAGGVLREWLSSAIVTVLLLLNTSSMKGSFVNISKQLVSMSDSMFGLIRSWGSGWSLENTV